MLTAFFALLPKRGSNAEKDWVLWITPPCLWATHSKRENAGSKVPFFLRPGALLWPCLLNLVLIISSLDSKLPKAIVFECTPGCLEDDPGWNTPWFYAYSILQQDFRYQIVAFDSLKTSQFASPMERGRVFVIAVREFEREAALEFVRLSSKECDFKGHYADDHVFSPSSTNVFSSSSTNSSGP